MSEERGEQGQDLINAKFNETPVPVQQEEIYVDDPVISALPFGWCVHILITYMQSASVAAAYTFCELKQFAFYTDSILHGFNFTIHPVLDT